MLGIIVGTASGLFIVKRTGDTPLAKRNLSPRRLRVSRQNTASKTSKTRTSKSRPSRRSRSRMVLQPTQTVEVPSVATVAQTPVSSCPACGLQGPPNLLAEHFLGSPSHEEAVIPLETATLNTNPKQETMTVVTDEDSSRSLRHLLQMLVPPRPFGRRHEQRTVNPLSRLVQTVEESRNGLVRPLRRP